MNAYFAVERNRFDWMNIARFTAGRDEFFPISIGSDEVGKR